MKTILINAILMMMSISCFSQDSTRLNKSIQKTNYLKKAQTQQSISIGLLGGGAFIGLTGFVIANSGAKKGGNDDTKVNIGTGLFIAGSACILASIPLFILSQENKRKAREITIQMQRSDQLRSNVIHWVHYPVLTLRFNL